MGAADGLLVVGHAERVDRPLWPSRLALIIVYANAERAERETAGAPIDLRQAFQPRTGPSAADRLARCNHNNDEKCSPPPPPIIWVRLLWAASSGNNNNNVRLQPAEQNISPPNRPAVWRATNSDENGLNETIFKAARRPPLADSSSLSVDVCLCRRGQRNLLLSKVKLCELCVCVLFF